MKQTHRKFPAFLPELMFGILLILGGLYTYFAYSQFAPANWTFDDARILTGLTKVHSFSSSIEFIRGDKNVSFLGRPISIASFLLNIADWPRHPASFRNTNALLHILNAFLLALVALRAARVIPRLAPHANGFAVTLSLIWLMHPLLASTSFHLIQRMTLLAATFSLCGCWTYIHGRTLLLSHPHKAFTWMSMGLIFFIGLGVLAKENAALTALMIAVLEFTVLSYYAPVHHRFLKHWKTLFFVFPAIILLAYFGYYIILKVSSAYYVRPFTLSERLFSESVILFEYIRQILVPDIALMGHIQDDTSRILGASTLTTFAIASWFILIGSAIYYRKQFPIYAFAILFFCVGHLLESTFFSLELYFEHRNYLPSLGPLAVLTGIAWAHPKYWPKAITLVYSLTMAGLLWMLTTLWGHPLLGPMAWAEAHPTSKRSAQTLASAFERLGQREKAAQILEERYRLIPKSSSLAADVMRYQCVNSDKETREELIKQINLNAPTMNYSRSITSRIYRTLYLMSHEKCRFIRPEQMISFIRGLLSNPIFRNQTQRYVLYHAISRFSELHGNREQSLEALIQAYYIRPWPNALPKIYCQLRSIGQHAKATNFIDNVTQRSPQLAKRLANINNIKCAKYKAENKLDWNQLLKAINHGK